LIRIGGKETNLDHLLVKGERRRLREGKALGAKAFAAGGEKGARELATAGLEAGEVILWLEGVGEEYGERISPSLADYMRRAASLGAGKRLQSSLPLGRKANFRLISDAAGGYVARQRTFNACVSRALHAAVLVMLLEIKKGQMLERPGPARISPHAGPRESELAEALLASVTGACFFLGLPGVEVCERLLERGKLEGGISDSPWEAVYYQENFLPVICRGYGDFLRHAPRWDFSALVIARPESFPLGLLEAVFRRAAFLGYGGDIWLSATGHGDGRPRGAGLAGWSPELLRCLAERRGFSAEIIPGQHGVLLKTRMP